jgi:hypothetical protein
LVLVEIVNRAIADAWGLLVTCRSEPFAIIQALGHGVIINRILSNAGYYNYYNISVGRI